MNLSFCITFFALRRIWQLEPQAAKFLDWPCVIALAISKQPAAILPHVNKTDDVWKVGEWHPNVFARPARLFLPPQRREQFAQLVKFVSGANDVCGKSRFTCALQLVLRVAIFSNCECVHIV